MKLIVGNTYLHPTLGLVKLLTDDAGASTEVRIMTTGFKRNSEGCWTDDWGSSFATNVGDAWWVSKDNLKPVVSKLDPLDKNRSPVQIRCKKLWNESKWVKTNPRQAYK